MVNSVWFHSIIDLVFLAIKFFFVFSLMWLLFYFVFIRRNYLNKYPLVLKSEIEIEDINFPINRKLLQEDTFCIFYKNTILLEFNEIAEYCDFCLSFGKGLKNICFDENYIDKDNFDLFINKLGIEFVNYELRGYKHSDMLFPGRANKLAVLYEEIYCDFSKEFAKFYYCYVANTQLFLGLGFLYFSVINRDNIRFIKKNGGSGLNSVDLYSNSFARNKKDILTLWYGLISIKSGLFFNSIYNCDSGYFFNMNLHLFDELLVNFTKAIINDKNVNLTMFQRFYLEFFLFNFKIKEILNSKKFSKCFIFYSKLNIHIIAFFKLIPITLLLYIMYNTQSEYSELAKTILTYYIVIIAIKNSYLFIEKIIHFVYDNKEEREKEILVLVCKKFLTLVGWILAIILASYFLGVIYPIIINIPPTDKYIFLSFYLVYIINVIFKNKDLKIKI